MILKFDNLTKRYGGITALDHVTFDIEEGSIHALVGANGAGKSTLMKILAGMTRGDSGRIYLRDMPVDIDSPIHAQRLGIGLVPQDPLLAETQSVAENILLGKRLLSGPFGFVSRRKLMDRSQEILSMLGSEIDPAEPVSSISVAQKQIVQIARALAFSPKILALDEPTASLSQEEARTLFSILRTLNESGVTILYVSHRLEEIFEIANEVTVLRDGLHIGTRITSETRPEEIVTMMVRSARLEPTRRLAPKSLQGANKVLSVANLSSDLIRNINFRLAAGEVLGWYGLVGAGRTETARALFGLDRASGQIFVEGKAAKIKNPRDAIRRGILLVPEDRKIQGLFLSMSVLENLSLPTLTQLSRMGYIMTGREKKLTESLIEDLVIKTRGAHQIVSELSGGNQQKVALGKWLKAMSKVLILDEPTKGVDIAAKEEIHTRIKKLADKGLGIILISSELPEIQSLSDRILIFRRGEIVHEARPNVPAEEIMLHASGGKG